MILQKEIETSKAIILVIGGLPEDAYNVCIQNYGQIFYLIDSKPKVGTLTELLEHCNWQPLGFLKDITEEQAKELMDEVKPKEMNLFPDYNFQPTRLKACSWFNKATESLHSFIEANCKLENIWGDKPDKNFERYHKVWNEQCFDREWYENDLNRWNKEQEKVFTNPYLLLKHN